MHDKNRSFVQNVVVHNDDEGHARQQQRHQQQPKTLRGATKGGGGKEMKFCPFFPSSFLLLLLIVLGRGANCISFFLPFWNARVKGNNERRKFRIPMQKKKPQTNFCPKVHCQNFNTLLPLPLRKMRRTWRQERGGPENKGHFYRFAFAPTWWLTFYACLHAPCCLMHLRMTLTTSSPPKTDTKQQQTVFLRPLWLSLFGCCGHKEDKGHQGTLFSVGILLFLQ